MAYRIVYTCDRCGATEEGTKEDYEVGSKDSFTFPLEVGWTCELCESCKNDYINYREQLHKEADLWLIMWHINRKLQLFAKPSLCE